MTKTIGLALGGGGARGVAHIGVLSAIEEAGLTVHSIAGTSVGSLIGALYASGMSPAKMLEIAEHIGWSDLVSLTVPRASLVNATKMVQMIDELLGEADFTNLLIPFVAIACDLRTGEEIVLREGNVSTAVIASSSIPGIFAPVEMGGRLLVDGGIVNTVPVNVAKKLGADVVLAVSLLEKISDTGHLGNIFDILTQALEIYQRSQVMDKPDILIIPDLGGESLGSLSNARRYYEAGKAATEKALSQLKTSI
ncbi:MAG: patatin-like phospholipase family protein [bacterium]|nr:patatin-like phospholipase family protein [bacterium]